MTDAPTEHDLAFGQVQYSDIDEIRPFPENERLYHPIDPDDLRTKDAADSIRRRGLLYPLVTSADGWLISGRRRYVAARLVGRTQAP
jgi:ParB-like chromosome segregation protein Spo0J